MHHATAVKWFTTLDQDASLIFCRFTQLGLLRLLTAVAVMGDEVMTQPEAWAAYDRWQQDDRVELMHEPTGLEPRFRALTRRRNPATKDWADSYLAAFAASGDLTLVTFDRAMRIKIRTAHSAGRVRPQAKPCSTFRTHSTMPSAASAAIAVSSRWSFSRSRSALAPPRPR